MVLGLFAKFENDTDGEAPPLFEDGIPTPFAKMLMAVTQVSNLSRGDFDEHFEANRPGKKTKADYASKCFPQTRRRVAYEGAPEPQRCVLGRPTREERREGPGPRARARAPKVLRKRGLAIC